MSSVCVVVSTLAPAVEVDVRVGVSRVGVVCSVRLVGRERCWHAGLDLSM